MTALRHVANRIGAFMDMLAAAISVTAAVRSHNLPQARDLRRLGIEPTADAMAAMSRA